MTKLRDSAVKASATASISAWVLKVMTAVFDVPSTLSNLWVGTYGLGVAGSA